MSLIAHRFGIFSSMALALVAIVTGLMPTCVNAQIYPSNSMRPAINGVPVLNKNIVSRLVRRGPHPGDVPVDSLLAMIPASHPLRSELRVIAQQPAPLGYSNLEWITLAMKFDFRHGTGLAAGQLAARLDPYED